MADTHKRRAEDAGFRIRMPREMDAGSISFILGAIGFAVVTVVKGVQYYDNINSRLDQYAADNKQVVEAVDNVDRTLTHFSDDTGQHLNTIDSALAEIRGELKYRHASAQ